MGKQNRAIAQKTKVKQQQQNKKPKAVKTNLKRVRGADFLEENAVFRVQLNERVRDSVKQVDKVFEDQTKQQVEMTG